MTAASSCVSLRVATLTELFRKGKNKRFAAIGVMFTLKTRGALGVPDIAKILNVTVEAVRQSTTPRARRMRLPRPAW